MSVPAEQMQPPQGAPATPAAPAQGQPPQGGQQDALAALADVPPEIQVVVKECLEILDARGEELVGRIMQSAKTPAIGLSQATSALIVGVTNRLEVDAAEATGQSVNIDLNMLVGDGGPGEIVLLRMFEIAVQMGVPGAEDEAEYGTAGDALDVLLEMAEAAGQGGGQGGEPQGDPQAAPAQAPQQGGGWRQPA